MTPLSGQKTSLSSQMTRFHRKSSPWKPHKRNLTPLKGHLTHPQGATDTLTGLLTPFKGHLALSGAPDTPQEAPDTSRKAPDTFQKAPDPLRGT